MKINEWYDSKLEQFGENDYRSLNLTKNMQPILYIDFYIICLYTMFLFLPFVSLYPCSCQSLFNSQFSVAYVKICKIFTPYTSYNNNIVLYINKQSFILMKNKYIGILLVVLGTFTIFVQSPYSWVVSAILIGGGSGVFWWPDKISNKDNEKNK